MSSTVHIIVNGKVQGVGFRWFVKQAADNLNLAGFVRNLPDGRVEVEAQGEPGSLDQLIARIRKGPTFSRVSEIKTSRLEQTVPHETFEIRY